MAESKHDKFLRIAEARTNKIIDMGVRLFNSAGANNNQERREARSARRTLHRKNHRLQNVEEFLLENGFNSTNRADLNPYELRVKGLNEKQGK